MNPVRVRLLRHLLLVAAVVLTACVPASVKNGTMATRLIEQAPTERFDRQEVCDIETVRRWTLTQSVVPGLFDIDLAPDEYRATEGGLSVKAGQRFFSLTANLELDPSDVDLMEIEAVGLGKKPLSIMWAGPGQAFSKEKQLTVDSPASVNGRREVYRFRLVDHSKWSEPVGRVRISIVLPRSNEGTVESIAFRRETLEQRAYSRASRKVWRIEVDDVYMPGWVANPEEHRDIQVRVPEGGILRTAIATLGRARREVSHIIEVIEPNQDPVRLLETTGTQRGEEWMDEDIDLEPWAGRDVVIRFSVRVPPGTDVAIPVWGNPSIVGEGDRPRPNIVLISLDTLRADHLSLNGYERETTPNIDRWAERQGAVVFTNAVASASWTLPSHVSLFTGLDAHRHGVNQNKPMPWSMVTLAERLEDDGYTTIGVNGGGFVHASFGFDQGFGEYRSFSSRMGFANELESGIERALERVRHHAENPFFLFFHTYEIHNPFRPRRPSVELVSGRDLDLQVDVKPLSAGPEDGYLTHRDLVLAREDGTWLDERPDDMMEYAVDLYDAGIHFTDQHIGRFLAELEGLGLMEDTIVVITSDHGELFGEHGEVNHYTVFEENVRVPLVIRAPGGPPELRKISDQVRLVDVMPTLLALAGAGVPDGIDGVSLADAVTAAQWLGFDRPNPAWSYASTSNWGVALRDGSGVAYLFRNGAWTSTVPREEWLVEWGDQEGLTRTTAEAGMRDVVTAGLSTQLPGLRMKISNLNGPVPIDGTCSGPLIGLGAVSVADAESAILERAADGSAGFSVEPGEQVLIIFERLSTARLVLMLDEQRFNLEVGANDGVVHLVRSGAGWVEAPGTDHRAEDGVSIWWQGPENPESEQTLSAEVENQLRALGYLDGGGA